MALGQSLSKAGLYIPISVSTYGNLYVGFPRVGDQIQVSVYEDQAFYNVTQHLEEGSMHTQNVIYLKIFKL